MSFLDTSLDLQEFNFWPGYKSAALGTRGGGWARAAAGAGIRKSIPLCGEVGAGEIYLPCWRRRLYGQPGTPWHKMKRLLQGGSRAGWRQTAEAAHGLGQEGAGAACCPRGLGMASMATAVKARVPAGLPPFFPALPPSFSFSFLFFLSVLFIKHRA